MRLFSIFSTVLLASRYASAHAQNDNENDKEEQSSTITSSADLSCATGEAQTKYESCSSSISSKIDECRDDDLGCACKLANEGFGCITSYCPKQTELVCEASLALNNLCALAKESGPTLTHLTCPSSVSDLLGSLVPPEIRTNLPSNIRSFLPSDINTRIPSNIPFWNGPQETGSAGTTTMTNGGGSGTQMAAPNQTGAASRMGMGGKGAEKGLRLVLLMGSLGSVAVGGLAAYL